MKTFRIPLRVVFYKEEGEWVAHCLEFDLCGDGASKEEAVHSLLEAIRLQVEFSLQQKNPANLFSPAPSEIQAKFFAGKVTGDMTHGELKMSFQPIDHLVIEDTEYREYSEDFADSDPGCVAV